MATSDPSKTTARRGRRPAARIARGLTYAPLVTALGTAFLVLLTPVLLVLLFAFIRIVPLHVIAVQLFGSILLGLYAYTLLNYLVVYRTLEAVRLLNEASFLAASVAWPGIAFWIWMHKATPQDTLWRNPELFATLVAGLSVLSSAAFWRLSAPAVPESEETLHGPAREGGARLDADLRRFAATLASTGITGGDLVEHLRQRGLSREAAERIANEVQDSTSSR